MNSTDHATTSGDPRERVAVDAGLLRATHTFQSLLSLGHAAATAGLGERALIFLRAACELHPAAVECWQLYAQALVTSGHFNEAVDALQRVLAAGKGNEQALLMLGAAYIGIQDAARASVYFESALKLNPSMPDPWKGLGLSRLAQRRQSEAAEAFERALRLEPRDAEAWNCLGVVLHDMGQLNEGQRALERALEVDPDLDDARTNVLFYSNCSADISLTELAESHRAWGTRLMSRVPKRRATFPNERDPSRVLRVGYVSADLREHSVAYYLAPLLGAHDPTSVQAICYSAGTECDWMTWQLRHLAAEWRSIAELDDDAAQRLIEDDRIDILVDLSGHTAGSRLGLFARRPAPIQVSYLGYPNTTGLETVDYRITDAFADPPGASDAHYIEELVRPSTSFLCYEPPPGCPPVQSPPCERFGSITFGCFNHLRKITDRSIQLWSRVLRAVPNSRLLLKSIPLTDEECQQRVTERFEQAGVGAYRLVFEPFTPKLRDHLRCYGRVDIALDTFPYNGTTTTCEALWMGVPVVTLAGADHRSRVGLTLLNAAQLTEFVAESENEFVAVAARLATDTTRLASLRRTMRERLKGAPLLDAESFTRAVENEYRRMWRRWCEANPEKRDD